VQLLSETFREKNDESECTGNKEERRKIYNTSEKRRK